MVDLTSKVLRLQGVTRGQLIDTKKDQYPFTLQWAEAIHAQRADANCLYWVSRQDDTAVAIVLFGDRAPAGTIIPQEDECDLLDDEAAYTYLVSLAGKIGVLIIPSE